MKRWLILLAFCILAAPTLAQERTGGAIYLVNPSDNENLNPLLCVDIVCQQLGALFFPRLVAIDPERAILTASTGDDRALALDWQTENGLTYEFTLRDNLAWDDGAPVTAYDVFYSYLAIRSFGSGSPYNDAVSRVRAMIPRDATHLSIVMNGTRCDVLDALNFPVLPAHVFDANFAESAKFDADDSDVAGLLSAWRKDHAPDFSQFGSALYNYTLPVTLAGNDVSEIHGGDYIRFTQPGGVGAYVYNRIDTDSAVDYFLNGTLDYLYHPPYSRWNDILASDATTYIHPGYALEYIGFNMADPREPRAYRDEDGNIQEQKPHPILSDLRVRQAVQIGIDVQALMDVAVQGYGTPIATNQPPGSWALNPDLKPAVYDPDGAKRLLDEAGWIASATDNSVRRCMGCLYLDTGIFLTLNLTVTDTPAHRAMIPVLLEQLRAIGMDVNADFVSPDGLQSSIGAGRYDMVLATQTYDYPANPHRFDAMFDIAQDTADSRGANTSSYNNPEVMRLLEDARTYPDCDYETRAKLYGRAQELLNDDLPYLWLFAPDEMVSVRGWVQNTRMYPYQPFWNLDKWAVSYVQGK